MRHAIRFLLFLLCLCFPLRPAFATEEDPFAAHFWAGEQVRLDFSIVPEAYMGAPKESLAFWQGLFSELSGSYVLQGDSNASKETLSLSNKDEALISLSRLWFENSQYLESPDLEYAIRLPRDADLMQSLFGGGFLPGSAPSEALFTPPTHWASFRAELTPIGSPEEGFAVLLSGKDATRALHALFSLLGAEELGQAFFASIGELPTFAEPLSLYWTEDKSGRVTSCKTFVVFASDLELSLSMRESYSGSDVEHRLSGTLSRGEDEMELSLRNRLTQEGGQARTRLIANAKGTWTGETQAFGLTWNDTRTENKDGKKSMHTFEFRKTKKNTESSLRVEEESLAKNPLRKSGTWHIEGTQNEETLFALSVPFALTIQPGEPFAPPEDVEPFTLVAPEDTAFLAETGQALLDTFLTRWIAGLPKSGLEDLLPR